MRAKKKIVFTVSLMLISVFTCSCASGREDIDNIVYTEEEDTDTDYNFTIAEVRDIEKTTKVRCVYEAMSVQYQSYKVDGQEIQNVYVKKGDDVYQGQLLAQLTSDEIEEQIVQLQYELDRNELLLQQTKNRQKAEEDIAYLNFTYTNMWYDDQVAYEESISEIEENYRYSIEDYEDAIELANKKISKLEQEIESGNLYASMDGTISFVKDQLEGSTTVKDETIFTITDSADCIFVAEDKENAKYFTSDSIVEMEVYKTDGMEVYEAVPYHLEETDMDLRFVLTDDIQNELALSVGTRGIITIVLEKREQVLSVPDEAIHEADGKYYVYIVDETDHKQTRWVETGLTGDSYIEILSGLSEGDKVII